MDLLAAPSLRLAVLPFEDPKDESGEEAYFSRGFVEDLITDLSRFPNLGLISSNSSFDTNLRSLDDRQIAEGLHCDLLLKTGVRRRAETIRLNAQLVDPESGSILWAERYDTPAKEVFALQDSLVEKVTSALSIKIDSTTLETARRKPVTELAAYDCWLRGLEKLREGSIETDEEAREFFDHALEIDPLYARAYVGLSLSHFNEWSCQQWELSEVSECHAFQYAHRAFQLDPNDHVAHLVLGRVYLFRGEFEKAQEHMSRSFELNPNDADHLVQIGSCLAFLGEASAGADLFNRAVALNPYCDPWYYAYGGFIQIMLRNFDEGIALGLKAPLTSVWIDLAAFLALAHAHNGNEKEAAVYMQIFLEAFQEKILKGRPPRPGEAMQWLLDVNPFRRPEDSEFYAEGLRRAGLSEPSETNAPVPAEAAESTAGSSGEAAIFRTENNLRTIAFAGTTVQLPDVKGFSDLEALLAHASEEVHCTELMGVVSTDAPSEEAMDARARAEYAARIRELQAELDEADSLNDTGRAEKIREELDPLMDHLAKSMGIGGRSRRLAAPSERARSAVTMRIRSAIRKIEAAHPELGQHFANSVRTGTFCSYCPEKPVDWAI